MARWERVALVGVLLVAGAVAATVASATMWGFVYFLGPDGSDGLGLADDGYGSDWSAQPIEVVVDEGEQRCAFNVDAVAPGRHEVNVIANDVDSEVVVRDPSGDVVLRQAESGEDHFSHSRTLRLRLGTYDVECRTPSRTMHAELPVVPASELG